MESNLRKCKVCSEEKMRILNGRYPNKKDRRWVDSSGKQWSGNICPDCQRINQKRLMGIKRATKVS